MKPKKMRQIHSYTVDQSKTDRKGAFPCPCCGNFISPSDHSERAYSILEAKMSGTGLEEIVIICKGCGSQVNLTGFSSNSQLNEINGDVTYIAHI